MNQPAVPPRLPPPPPPPSVGKYSLECRLGQGGMAEVFKGHIEGPHGFRKVVVIKRILPQHLEDPDFLRMFLDEARLAANLAHPNLVQIYDVDEHNGVPYLAMEYVKGPTFQGLMRAARAAGDVQLGCIAKILSKVCDGLHHAHHAQDAAGQPLGIVHRDVSPQNILVSGEGVPKLVDFGVAKARGRSTHSSAGVVKGKLRYVAPEQIQGRPIDGRVDVFATGVVLYEATTGHMPFDGDSEGEVMQVILRGDYARPSQWVENYPVELERIIAWALHADVERRCPSAKALQEALEAFVSTGEFTTRTQEVAAWVERLFPDTGAPAEMRYLGRASLPPGAALDVRAGTSPLLSDAGTETVGTADIVPLEHTTSKLVRLPLSLPRPLVLGVPLLLVLGALSLGTPAVLLDEIAPPGSPELNPAPEGIGPAVPEPAVAASPPPEPLAPPLPSDAPMETAPVATTDDVPQKPLTAAAARRARPASRAASTPAARTTAAPAPPAAEAPEEDPGAPSAADVALAHNTLKLAEQHYANQNLDEALRAARLAIALNPNLAAAHSVLGLVLAASGDCPSANNQFSQALVLDRKDSRALAGRLACREY